jgi:hypothetical protein
LTNPRTTVSGMLRTTLVVGLFISTLGCSLILKWDDVKRLPDAGAGGLGAGGASAGSLSAGGASARGASGGGAAGSSGAANRFRGGPCVATPDQSANVMIFARSAQYVYQATVAPGGSPTWTPAVDSTGKQLQAATVSDSSDLDCSGNAPVIQIVALSGMPVGNVLVSTGDGMVFSQLSTTWASNYTYNFSPAIFTSGNNFYQITETKPAQTGVTTGAVAIQFYNGTATVLDPPDWALTISLVSGTDVGQPPGSDYDAVCIVAFAENGLLEAVGFGGNYWGSPEFFEPPLGNSFQYSPSICYATTNPSSNGAGHVVAVAGDHIWHSMSSPTGWSGWEKMSDTPVASAPDCTVTWDDTVHVVALTPAGSVLHVWGAPGSFSANDLGTY